MARRRTRAAKAANRKKYISVIAVAAMLGIIVAGGAWYVSERSAMDALDENLCPPEPAEYVAVVVDVTDPLTLAQRQDLRNKLDALTETIPLGGRLAFFRVAPAQDKLLEPLLEVCNPGSVTDFSEMSRDLKQVQEKFERGFEQPILDTYEKIFTASGSEQSPILSSMQSVNLTELQTGQALQKPRRLILISDLLENTSDLSFYGRLPTAEEVLESAGFTSRRTDLRGVEVELWMLQRSDYQSTQPRALPELWNILLREQGARSVSAERISG